MPHGPPLRDGDTGRTLKPGTAQMPAPFPSRSYRRFAARANHDQGLARVERSTCDDGGCRIRLATYRFICRAGIRARGVNRAQCLCRRPNV